MMKQPEIKMLNDFQVTRIIQNGALIFCQETASHLKISYEAITVDGKLAYFKHFPTGQEVSSPSLVAIVNIYIALCS
jgi:hypothetical protein